MPAPMETQKRSFVSKNSLAIILDTDDGPVYCCVECPSKYTDKEKLEVHLCTHYDEYRFLCGICGTGLKRKEHLDRHVLGHQEVRPHVCAECGKGFKRKEHLNIHRSIHSGDKSQICPLCHRSFYRKDHLQKHMQTHSKLFMSQHLVSLDDQEMMQVKQEMMDDEDIKPIINEQGDITMKVEEKKPIEQPLFIKSNDPQRPFECITCHKTYKRKDHLKLHSMTHVEKDKICSECGKAFHKEEQLLFHMNVHLGIYPELGQEQRFKVAPNAMVDHCDIDIMPLDSSALLVPRARASGGPSATGADAESRPHECGVCRRRFKRKQHLKAHANVHFKQPSLPPPPPPTIWCSLCNAGFVSNSQFESHQCLHHVNGGDSQTNDQSTTDYNDQSNTDYNDQSNTDYNDQSNTEYTSDQADYTDQSIVTDDDPDDPDDPDQSDMTEYGDHTAVAGPTTQDHKKENHLPLEFVPIPIVNCMSSSATGAEAAGAEAHIPTPVKVYVCKFCQKPFRRKDHYKIHLHIHTGVKTAFCPDCGKGFYRKDHLQKHMSIHVRHRPERAAPRGAPDRPRRALPGLYPINMLKDAKPALVEPEITIKPVDNIKPEITITAPSSAKLRVPLQIKVPYQMVIAGSSPRVSTALPRD